MSIRRRAWTSPKGESKTAWLVDYRDSAGARRAKQFARKKDAEAWQTETAWQVSRGTHTADSRSITIAAAAEYWLARGRREGLEPTTLAAYEQHARLHIRPLCGEKKLSQLTKPIVESYRDQLVDRLSRAMARRVMRSLSGIVAEAERRGFVAQNVCLGVTVRRSKREKSKIAIPTKEEMRAMIRTARASSNPMGAPLLVTYIFVGPRASELRGLSWAQVNLKAKTLEIDRRADAYNQIGSPKSAAGHRSIPLADVVVSELRKWKLRCPKTELDLVFPSEHGSVLSHTSLHRLHLHPIQVAAGVADPVLDKAGQPKEGKAGAPLSKARYASHALRHCAVSLWIEQRISPKRIQQFAGHHSVAFTFDTYGHLFAQAEADSAVMAAVEREVLGSADAT